MPETLTTIDENEVIAYMKRGAYIQYDYRDNSLKLWMDEKQIECSEFTLKRLFAKRLVRPSAGALGIFQNWVLR